MKHYYTCSFERFSDESKRTAVFRMHRMIKTAKSCCPKFSAVESCLAKRPTCYYPRPPQVVYFRRLANDTEIPGLKIKDNHPTEMECDWRGTFTALLWESKLVDPDHFKVSIFSRVMQIPTNLSRLPRSRVKISTSEPGSVTRGSAPRCRRREWSHILTEWPPLWMQQKMSLRRDTSTKDERESQGNARRMG